MLISSITVSKNILNYTWCDLRFGTISHGTKWQKHLRRSIILSKVTVWRPDASIKIALLQRGFAFRNEVNCRNRKTHVTKNHQNIRLKFIKQLKDVSIIHIAIFLVDIKAFVSKEEWKLYWRVGLTRVYQVLFVTHTYWTLVTKWNFLQICNKAKFLCTLVTNLPYPIIPHVLQ